MHSDHRVTKIQDDGELKRVQSSQVILESVACDQILSSLTGEHGSQGA